ncbi:hypothetical protein DNU06_01120 [Putridiphycobacter roseus]|uniref:DUF4834 domain-containing protein n=2 Tax=Putridiphycobacter roseus TaxID=2219161 RepID=A0A2W1N3N7_9FLAO|nr:hypothetical protein DNU06_01120 [Putridiphycobacter roseus]
MIGIRQILVIIGVIVIFRLIGKVMMVRRNVQEDKNVKANASNTKSSFENVGKTSIHKVDKNKIRESEYTDFEELD